VRGGAHDTCHRGLSLRHAALTTTPPFSKKKEEKEKERKKKTTTTTTPPPPLAVSSCSSTIYTFCIAASLLVCYSAIEERLGSALLHALHSIALT
jgi:hypothetical protein